MSAWTFVHCSFEPSDFLNKLHKWMLADVSVWKENGLVADLELCKSSSGSMICLQIPSENSVVWFSLCASFLSFKERFSPWMGTEGKLRASECPSRVIEEVTDHFHNQDVFLLMFLHSLNNIPEVFLAVKVRWWAVYMNGECRVVYHDSDADVQVWDLSIHYPTLIAEDVSSLWVKMLAWTWGTRC